MMRFILNYELDNGKVVKFEFNENIDFEKYNKTLLKIYGTQIKKRYVIDTKTGDVMSLKKLKRIINDL